MAQVLEEVDDLPVASCMAVSDAIMKSLLGLVGASLTRVEFPLLLVGIDHSGYCVQFVLSEPGEWPVVTYRYDPLNMGARCWNLPCSISVSDAKGSHVGVTIDGDIRAGKIRLIRDGDSQLVH